MSARSLVAAAFAAVLVLAGCAANTRHEVLAFFFDGVPAPRAAQAAGAEQAAARPPGVPRPGASKHVPYAEKQCDACHDAKATHALVKKGDTLCFECHQLNLAKAVVHSAIGASGCTGCHDPHTSRYPHLLAADGDQVCFACHDKDTLDKEETHRDRPSTCLSCHEPHASDQKNLLK